MAVVAEPKWDDNDVAFAPSDAGVLPRLAGVPESLPRERVLDLLAALGLPHEDLVSFSLHRGGIKAEVRARHPETGRRYLLESGEVATHHIVIPITD